MIVHKWLMRALAAGVATAVMWLLVMGFLVACGEGPVRVVEDIDTVLVTMPPDSMKFESACGEGSGWGMCALAHYDATTMSWKWYGTFNTVGECQELAQFTGASYGSWMFLSRDSTNNTVTKSLQF